MGPVYLFKPVVTAGICARRLSNAFRMWPQQPRCSHSAYSSFYWQQHQPVFGSLRFLFGRAGGVANTSRDLTIQRLAAERAQYPDNSQEADRLLVATFKESLEAQVQRRWVCQVQ